MQHTITEMPEMRCLDFPEIKVFRSVRRADSRGWIAPGFSASGFREAGINFDMAHENLCWSDQPGTIRGFHYQLPPYAQAKLITVTRGRIFDVNVDLRRGSPTFGEHIRIELDADDWNQILVPAGFAHCYCTLTENVHTLFKLGCEYAPAFARGLAWNDPDLGIDWPLSAGSANVLPRDQSQPRLRDLTEFFPDPAD